MVFYIGPAKTELAIAPSIGRRSRQLLTWAQRIAAAIGVAKGIQFLHTGIVPGMYSNNLKITDVLLDKNLIAKISSYNLPLLGEETGEVWRFVLSCSLFCIHFVFSLSFTIPAV